MKPTRDSHEPEKAAVEQTAAGGNDAKDPAGGGPAQPGAPRSWRQYIEENLPAQNIGTEAGRENAAGRTGPDAREKAGAALARFTRWAGENGGKVRSRMAAAREKLASAADWEKLGQGMEKLRGLVARHPISPLLYATLLAVGIGAVAFQGSYARAFELEVNGQKVGLVSSEDEANAILDSVETRAAGILGGVDYDVDVSWSPVYAALGALSDASEMEDVLLGEVAAYMRQTFAAPPAAADVDADGDGEDARTQAWALSVDGVELAYAADRGELYRMLDEIAQPYLPDGTVRYEFMEDVQVYSVELPPDTVFDSLESVQEELSALRVEEAVYVVKKGDTFNAIAYSLGMKPNALSVLNPDVMVDRLQIDQKLVIQQAVPRLSVLAFTNETYEEVVLSPVEYIETADLYVGDTKVKKQGEDGLALINAEVAFLNNVEQGRTVLESTTLKETTTTYTYTGTTPRPKTASNGYYIWPVKGTITSKFGARDLWGSYDYHKGLDIGCPTGTAIKAADGGTVITAGWNSGGYGNLVVIRHDNGTLTYYAHNSSILVKVGDKVYQGQIIAKAGMTGKADGPHCHFEIRINGACVNPLKYLP